MRKFRAELIEALKEEWLSNFQVQLKFKSSSADRVMRFIKDAPPQGYQLVSRKKEIEGYNKCLEYKLVEVA